MEFEKLSAPSLKDLFSPRQVLFAKRVPVK